MHVPCCCFRSRCWTLNSHNSWQQAVIATERFWQIALQKELEGISDSLRIPGNKSLGPVAKVHSAPNLYMMSCYCSRWTEQFTQRRSTLSNASSVCRHSGRQRVCCKTTSRPSLLTLLMTRRCLSVTCGLSVTCSLSMTAKHVVFSCSKPSLEMGIPVLGSLSAAAEQSAGHQQSQ